MERVERLVEDFVELSELLYSEDLDPSPDRRDWSEHRDEIDELRERFEALLPAVDECAGELDDEVVSALERKACDLGLGVFAALRASGQVGQALPLLETIAERSRGGADAELFAAVGRDLDSGTELARLRYRVVRGDLTARPALKRLAKTTSESAIAAEALEIFHAPRPLESAPSLWSFNGFGTNLFGSRDVDSSDGSEVKTLCLTALFVPVFPVRAYRVIDNGDRSFYFMSKNRLSGFARAYQKLVALAVVGLIAYFAIGSYLSSADRLSGKELAAADAAREAGDIDAAIERYDRVVDKYWGEVDRQRIDDAARRATELRLQRIERPLSVDRLSGALGVIRAVGQYPSGARAGAGATLSSEVLAWSDELEKAEAADAALTLLDAALAAMPPGQEAPIDERARAVRTRLAAALAPRRPYDALVMLVELGAADRAAELIAGLLERPSLLREAAPLIERWLQVRPDDNVRARLAEAIALDSEPTRAAALEGGDAEAIAAAIAKHPGDHELTAALAELDRAAGKPADALARLAALGEPGWLTGAAQQALAMAYVDAGDLEAADRILDELLRYRLPAFRHASAAYRGAAERFRESLGRRVESGSAPPDVMAAFNGSDQQAAYAQFDEWAAGEMANDPDLARLRAEYARHGIAVAASLSLGTIKLQLANGVDGDEREKLLGEAERTFVAIGDDAAGVPSYHLGLGQVYHRLGKRAEGDAELAGLLQRNEPELSLAVSSAYRELGQNARAREVAEKVYKSSASPVREVAASKLSVIAEDLDDKAMWLERADASNPEVRAQLGQVRAMRASLAGDDKKAAELYREVARHYEKSAEHSSASANNAAIAHRGIYHATGDRRALARARAGLESALRLEPTNALVVGNLAEHTHFEGWLEVLSAELPADVLRLDDDDVAAIAGQLRPESALVKRAARNALLRRSAELTSQEIVLAPSAAAGWKRASETAYQRRDVEALEALARQLDRVEIDTSGKARMHAAWVAGEQDERYREQVATETRRHTAMLAAARKSGSARAVAAARFLLGGTAAAGGWMSADAAQLEIAFEHLVAARDGWPELGDTASDAALRLAIVRAGASHPRVKAMREAGYRDLPAYAMLVEELIGGGGDAIRAALAADPAITATARWLAGAGDVAPSLHHWIIGVLAGDRAVAGRGASALGQRHRVIANKVETRLNPVSKATALKARLYEKPETLDVP